MCFLSSIENRFKHSRLFDSFRIVCWSRRGFFNCFHVFFPFIHATGCWIICLYLNYNFRHIFFAAAVVFDRFHDSIVGSFKIPFACCIEIGFWRSGFSRQRQFTQNMRRCATSNYPTLCNFRVALAADRSAITSIDIVKAHYMRKRPRKWDARNAESRSDGKLVSRYKFSCFVHEKPEFA